MKERLAGKLSRKNNVARQIQALLTTGYFFSVSAKKKICLKKINVVGIEGLVLIPILEINPWLTVRNNFLCSAGY